MRYVMAQKSDEVRRFMYHFLRDIVLKLHYLCDNKKYNHTE